MEYKNYNPRQAALDAARNLLVQAAGAAVADGSLPEAALPDFIVEIPADVKTMWYRFSRREDDYCIECSLDGEKFQQIRVCHMWEGAGTIRFGIYACSPENSSFKAIFTDMKITECAWKAHDGQAPDMI